jgi:hypothetical protein
MFQVYYKNAVTSSQRFQNAVVAGLGAAAGCVLVFYLIVTFANSYVPILFAAYGYIIGYTVRHCGKSITPRFVALAIGLTVLAILISDLLVFHSLANLVSSQFSGDDNISILWASIYRIAGIYLAYNNARASE